MTASDTSAFYDVSATRVELTVRDIADPERFGETLRVAMLTSITGGCDPVIVELEEHEALALAKAIRRGFKNRQVTAE